MKIGIVGAGTIVPDFLNASELINNIEISAICGLKGDQDKMVELSRKHNIKKIYFDYDDMLSDIEVDTLYIAVPNHMHYYFSKKALERNKNVICEKPFTSSYNQAAELANIALQKKLFIFEAISNQYNPNYIETKKLINNLGDIKIVEINYSQYSTRYDAFKKGDVLPVFDVKKSGGALMDLNVYNIHFTLGLFGYPDSSMYYANIEKGIDTSGVLILDYKNFKCILIGAKDCKAPTVINIQGDEGYIHSNSSANKFDYFTYGENNGKVIDLNYNDKGERLYYELNQFVKAVEINDYAFMESKLNKSLNVMKILDLSRDQAGIKYDKEF